MAPNPEQAAFVFRARAAPDLNTDRVMTRGDHARRHTSPFQPFHLNTEVQLSLDLSCPERCLALHNIEMEVT
jgi:hypothetical protein